MLPLFALFTAALSCCRVLPVAATEEAPRRHLLTTRRRLGTVFLHERNSDKCKGDFSHIPSQAACSLASKAFAHRGSADNTCKIDKQAKCDKDNPSGCHWKKGRSGEAQRNSKMDCEDFRSSQKSGNKEWGVGVCRQACNAGTYGTYLQIECQSCPAGRFEPSAGTICPRDCSDICTKCPKGNDYFLFF